MDSHILLLSIYFGASSTEAVLTSLVMLSIVRISVGSYSCAMVSSVAIVLHRPSFLAFEI